MGGRGGGHDGRAGWAEAHQQLGALPQRLVEARDHSLELPHSVAQLHRRLVHRCCVSPRRPIIFVRHPRAPKGDAKGGRDGESSGGGERREVRWAFTEDYCSRSRVCYVEFNASAVCRDILKTRACPALGPPPLP